MAARCSVALAGSGIGRDVQRPSVPRDKANNLPETSSSAFTHRMLSEEATSSIDCDAVGFMTNSGEAARPASTFRQVPGYQSTAGRSPSGSTRLATILPRSTLERRRFRNWQANRLAVRPNSTESATCKSRCCESGTCDEFDRHRGRGRDRNILFVTLKHRLCRVPRCSAFPLAYDPRIA